MTDGATYTARSWGFDGSLASKASQSLGSFTVDVTAPSQSPVTATGYSNGQWLDVAPGSNTFTFASSSADVVRFEYAKDGSTTWTSVGASGSNPTASLSWNPITGAHSLQVRAVDKAGWVSPVRTFTFGAGGAGLTSPVGGTKSTDRFVVQATAPAAAAGTVTPTVYWRLAGTANGAGYTPSLGSPQEWSTVSTLPAVAAGSAVEVSTSLSGAQIAASQGMSRVPLTIDVQVCFAYTSPVITRCTWNDAGSGTKPTVTRVPHAFGDAFPTADAGPGQVALWTGEFNTAATDVSVPGYVGALSVSRTYSTFAGLDTDSVFGPGWSASFDGTDIGVAGFEVVDNTSIDGTFALVDTEGEALIYRQPGDTKVAMKPGVYEPVDDDTAAVGATLTLTGAGEAARLVFIQDDGTVTTFSLIKKGLVVTGDWAPLSVAEPGSAGATTFTRDAATGRTTQILAPVPPGVTCATLVAGCRALQITYGTTTAGVDVAGQVKEIAYTAFDPQTATMTTTPVARYGYDSSHRLATVTDPRTGLSVSYGYAGTSSSGQPLLTTVTPPGQAPFTLVYGSTSQDATSLVKVTRADAGDGLGAQTLGRFVYGIDPTTALTGLPAMTGTDVAVWGQTTAPTYGAAVFGQDHQGVTTSNPASVAAGDWPFADVQYTDDQGRVVNTAAYGAGAWQLTATGYDAEGRVIRDLDQRAIDLIRQAVAGGASLSQAELDSYASITRYNTDVTTTAAADGPNGSTIAAGTVITAAGTVVTDTWSPAAPGADGELVRTHTHTDYDAGAPNQGVNPATGIAYRLPTAVTVTAADPLTGSADPAVPVTGGEPVLTRTTSGYAPIDGAALTDPTSGWTLAQATTSTVVTDFTASTGLTSKTRYDADGRVVETRQPASTGTDEGTTFVAYYTAAAQSGETAACGSKPAWAGLVCRTWHGGSTLPVITTTYSRYLAPAQVVETSGAATRTTTTTFDAAGRVTSTHVAATGLTGSAPVADSVTVYDAATGQATALVATTGGVETGRISTGFDGWGRTVSYTDTDGQTTTTGYDGAGRVVSVTDPKGVTTFAYDGAGEHRGVVTGQSVTNGAGSVLTFTATYDAAGDLVSQTLPGGVTQTTTVDRAGQTTGLAYADAAGDPLAGWSLSRDELGRVASQTGPSTSGGVRTTGYTYDNAARLVGVADLVDQVCTTRVYGFDGNGNRTGLTTTEHDPDTGCAGAVANQVVKAWTFTAADRVITGANATGSYAYDPLGRQTVLPGVDTPNGAGAGDLTVGYFDTDLAHTLTQDGVSTTFTLDPAGRRATETTTTGTSVVRHYADTSDNPAWATTTTGGATSTTRYLGSIGADLSVQVTDGVPTVTLTDPHGDVAATITVDPTNLGTATATTAAAFDEYGNPLTPPTSPGAISYGWLGAKERATNTATGLVLMGVRLYNAVTGLFTSVDPVPGGNTTAYTYPQDPINKYDLDGMMSSDEIKRHVVEAMRCASFGQAICTLIAQVTAMTAAIAKYFRKEPGRVNAIRHFIWSAALTALVGSKGAKYLTDAHELFLPAAERRDSRIDQVNNTIGRTWMGSSGASGAYRVLLSSGTTGMRSALTQLAAVGLAKWRRSGLAW